MIEYFWDVLAEFFLANPTLVTIYKIGGAAHLVVKLLLLFVIMTRQSFQHFHKIRHIIWNRLGENNASYGLHCSATTIQQLLSKLFSITLALSGLFRNVCVFSNNDTKTMHTAKGLYIRAPRAVISRGSTTKSDWCLNTLKKILLLLTEKVLNYFLHPMSANSVLVHMIGICTKFFEHNPIVETNCSLFWLPIFLKLHYS